MLVLGLESSAHTFGAGISDGGKILANEKAMYKIGATGMIPAEVAETHVENAEGVISAALEKAGILPSDLEGICYTAGPGMGPCLQVAQIAARALASKLKIRIVGVNHCVAHAEITREMGRLSDPIMLYVSGGNSQILALSDRPFRHYSVIGETFDIGVGNMLDNFARAANLFPAWGSSVEKASAGGRYLELPYTVKGMDFSFTGLLTRATELTGKVPVNDLSYSVQETAFSELCEATERAILLKGKKEIGVCGGVAQNSRLRQMLQSMASEQGIRFGFAPNEYNADNGGMIAYAGERLLSEGISWKLGECRISQRYRVDSAYVPGG